MWRDGLSYSETETLDKSDALTGSAPPPIPNPNLASSVSAINKRAPWVSPETQLALAKANASPAAIDAVAQMAASRWVDENQSSRMEVGQTNVIVRRTLDTLGHIKRLAAKAYETIIPQPVGAAAGAVFDAGEYILEKTGQVIKPATRYTFATLDAFPEAAQNAAAFLVGSSKTDLAGFWDSLSIATLLDNPEMQGDGYFIGERLRKEQARRAREWRGTLHGSAFTIGRGTAGMILRENTVAYKMLSGVIDAAVLLRADPTGLISKGISKAGKTLQLAAKAAKYGGAIDESKMPLISARDIAQQQAFQKFMAKGGKLTQKAKDKLIAEAGGSFDITGPNVNYQNWRKWMENNPLANELAERVAKDEDPLHILEQTFRYEISTDTAIKLANAKTKDAVINALEESAVLGRGAINQNIGRYIRSDSPLAEGIRKSRWFTRMPAGSIVVSGDRFDNVKSIRSMVDGMRIAGVSEEQVAKFGRKAIESFSELAGTPTARKAVVDTYRAYLDNVLEANGLIKEARESILARGVGELDAMKSYLNDRGGVPTDNGFVQAYMNTLKKYFPSDAVAAMVEDLTNVQKGGFVTLANPQEFAYMLDRLQVLPDIREIRRVTRNPFFTKWGITQSDMVAKTRLPGYSGEYVETAMQRVKKLPLTAARRRTMTKKITNRAEYQRLTEEIDDLERRFSGKINDDARAQIDALRDKRAGYVTSEKVWALSPKKRLPLAAVEWMQNTLWKPLNLATIGYIMRNGMDAQVRMAFAGLDSAPKHPFEYIQLVLGKKYRRGITGENIVGEGWRSSTWGDDIREELSHNMAAPGLDSMDTYIQGKATGSFVKVTRASAPGKYSGKWHTTGMIHQGQRIQRKDPATLNLLRMNIAGQSRTETVEMLTKYMENPFTPEYKKLRALFKDGIGAVNELTGQRMTFLPVDFDMLRRTKEGRNTLKNILMEHIDRVMYQSALDWTGDLDDVKFMFAYNAIPDYGARATVKLDELKGVQNARGMAVDESEIVLGGVAKRTMPDGTQVKGAIVGVTETDATFVPFKFDDVLVNADHRDGTAVARRLIDRAPIWDGIKGNKGLPQMVPYEQRKYLEDQKSLRLLDQGTNWFFNRLYESTSRTLEKSPVFRQFYYRFIDENIDTLSSDAAKQVLADLTKKASDEGMDLRTYMGVTDSIFDKFKVKNLFSKPEDVISKIERIANDAAHKGTATAAELDDFAKWQAIQDTKNLLYDASNISSIEDSTRLFMPFVTAWREILGTYATFLWKDNIRTVRSFQRVYTGLEEADPDNDGRGFFYRDPQTNDVMFTFPLSGNLAKALTGIYAPLEAPVRRLSQGISILPAAGPYGQLAASALIPDTPKYDKVNELFLPYGSRGLLETANPLPGWVKKMYEVVPGVGQRTNKMDTVYANTYIEVLRALSVNPTYDLSTEDGMIRLQADAKSRASIIAGMRAMSQFLGPTAGTSEFVIPTNQGDQFVSELTKELERFKQDDYDSAIQKFLDLYGDDLLLYTGSKTRSVKEGLETTQEFGVWERGNKELINAYPRTAAYLAPKGSEFNFSVWQRQLEEGSRERLTDVELVKLAQQRVGAVKYRAAQKAFGPYRTENQANALAAYREYLHSVLPGFPLRTEFKVNVFENDVEELKKLVDDPRAIRNADKGTRDMIDEIKEYLKYRDEAIAAAGGKSLKSKRATPYRAKLFSIGESFAESEPSFARIWQRLLSQEVED